jgi:DUF2946 family protein
MRRRSITIAILLFQALWLNIIVPGHQRGIVQLPQPKSILCPCCCESSGDARPASNSTPCPPHRAPENCAICSFAAHLTIPPPVDFTLPKLTLLSRVFDQTTPYLPAQFCFIPFDGRGPPVLASV